jgi:UDP-N-acetylmuramate--alanine ligase
MILDNKSFFLLGIKGAAMANLAVMIKQMGKQVTGVDSSEEFITDVTLSENGIPYSSDFSDLSLVHNCDVFVYSAAHGGDDNILAQEAIKHGKLIISQPQLIGELTVKFSHSFAVAGCHGKTTTSSLLAHSLEKLGVDPSFLIGAPPFEGSGGGKMTKSDYFVIEADEYGVHPPKDKTPKLLFLHPAYSLCMNIDFDHPDVYKNLDETKKTFIKFFDQSKHLVVCGEDPVILSLLKQIAYKSPVTYGLSNKNTYYVRDIVYKPDSTEFAVYKKDALLGTCTTELYGEKNVLNTLGVLALLIENGFEFAEVAKSVYGFKGAKRRMELIYTDNSSYLFDDYGHHPAEILATIQALKSRFPGKKLHVLFQPHTFSRTLALKEEFANVLKKADVAYIGPIFPSARENTDQFKVTSFDVARAAKSENVRAYELMQGILDSLASKFRPGDVVLTIGAGDIYKLKSGIIDLINEATT